MPHSSAERRRRVASAARWLRAPLRFPALTLLLILGATFVLAIRIDSVQGDTWWALRAGKDMWRTHRVITTDTYSYTAYGRSWPDHSWGYQVILYALYVIGGLPLLSITNAVVATLAAALARPRGRVTWPDVITIVPVVALLSLSWTLRPQVVSLLMLAIVIRLLHAERWHLVILTMLVWANLHGGVVYGGLMLAAATAAGLVAWLVGGRRADGTTRRMLRRRFRALVLTTMASAGATLLNPMGWGLWHYIATASSRPGQSVIQEWQPSWTLPGITGWFWIWSAVVLLTLLVRWRRLGQWPILLGLFMSLAIAPLAWLALRNISAFALVTFPLMVLLLRRQPAFGPQREVRPGSYLPGARLVLAVAGVALAVSTIRTLHAPVGLGWAPMSPEVAKAIDACPGRVYTTYNSGAYLIWFAPKQRVFVDNRQDPYDAETLAFQVGEGDWHETFEKYDIRCAALNLMADPQPVVVLGALQRWPVAYADGDWVVLRDPQSPTQAKAQASGAGG